MGISASLPGLGGKGKDDKNASENENENRGVKDANENDDIGGARVADMKWNHGGNVRLACQKPENSNCTERANSKQWEYEHPREHFLEKQPSPAPLSSRNKNVRIKKSPLKSNDEDATPTTMTASFATSFSDESRAVLESNIAQNEVLVQREISKCKTPPARTTTSITTTTTTTTTKQVVACPRFLDQHNRFCIEKNEIEKFFVYCIRTQRQSNNSTMHTKQDWAGFSFRIELGATELSHILVHLLGAPNLLRELIEALKTWYCEQSRQKNCQQIRELGTTVTVELDPTQNIGASLHHAKASDHSRAAEISVDAKVQGQLMTALGNLHDQQRPDYTPFGIVDRVQGVRCTSIQQFKEVVQIAKKNGTKLHLQLMIASPDQVDRLCRIPRLQPVTIPDASTESVVSTCSSTIINSPEPSRQNSLAEKPHSTIDQQSTEQSSPVDNDVPVHTGNDTNVVASITPLVPETNHAIDNSSVKYSQAGRPDQSNVGLPLETESVPEECSRILFNSPSAKKRDDLVVECTESAYKFATGQCLEVDPPNQCASPASNFTSDPPVLPQDNMNLDHPSPSQKADSLLDCEKPRSAVHSNKKKRKMPLSGCTTRERKTVRFSLESADGSRSSPTELFRNPHQPTVTTTAEHSDSVDIQTIDPFLPSLVLDHPCCDLVSYLTAGYLNSFCMPGQLDELRLLIKTTLQELNTVAPKNEDYERAVSDLTIKDRALKIVSLAIKAGEQAKSLEEWERIQIKIKKIDDIVLADSIAATPEMKIKAEISAVFGNSPEVLRRLPWVSFKEDCVILYDVGTCQLNYNPESQTDRLLVVNLYATNDKIGREETSSLLGEIVVRLSDLHNELVAPDVSIISTFAAVPGNKLLYARVHLAARRFRASEEYIEKKRQIARSTLQKVVDLILDLNNDVTVWNSRFPDAVVPLCAFANMRLGDNDSLLHTAVYMCDLEFVNRVLSLGFRPFAESTAVSAMALAQKRLAESREIGDLENIVGALNEFISNCPSNELVQPLGTIESESASLCVAIDEDFGGCNPLSACNRQDIMTVASADATAGEQEGSARKVKKVLMDQEPKRNIIVERASASGSRTKRNKCDYAAQSGTKAKNESPLNKGTIDVLSLSNRPMSADATASEALPMLSSSDWLVPANRRRHLCTHWEKNCFCDFGFTCKFIHRQRPWGSKELEAVWSQMGNHCLPICQKVMGECLVTECRVDSHGREWWTAGYTSASSSSCRKQCQEIFYAEGMRSSVNSQGVSWYTTRREACVALERVIIVSRYAAHCNIRPPPKEMNEPLYQNAADGLGYYGPAAEISGAADVQQPAATRRISLPGTSAAVKPSTGILMPSKYSAAVPKPCSVTTRFPTLPKCTRKQYLPAANDVDQSKQKRVKATLPSALTFAEERNAI